MKLIQKAFLKGSREFELTDDVVNVRLTKLFKEEKLTVGLSALNPEPVINEPYLEFHGRTNNQPLLSLLLNEPNAEDFNSFVDTLKQRAAEESSAFNTINAISQPASQAEGLAANSYDEPPEFEEPGPDQLTRKSQAVKVERVNEAIEMLERYLDTEEVKPLLAALKALQAEPHNEAYFVQVEKAFNALGITQGAVLTYAPYISIMLTDNQP